MDKDTNRIGIEEQKCKFQVGHGWIENEIFLGFTENILWCAYIFKRAVSLHIQKY